MGLALAGGFLAEPFLVVRVISVKGMVEKVVRVVKAEEVDRVVVGVSE